MKKRNSTVPNKISPEEAVEFIESFQSMIYEKDEATVAISVRIPANILRALKTQAKIKGKKYQSLLVEYLREGLREDHK